MAIGKIDSNIRQHRWLSRSLCGTVAYGTVVYIELKPTECFLSAVVVNILEEYV